MSTLGQKWKERIAAQAVSDNTAKIEADRKRCEEEARFGILRIPQLIDEAFDAKRDHITILPSVLCFSDVACANVDEFTRMVGQGPVQAHQLAGRARIIFDHCVANDLVCYVKGVNKEDSTLIAKLCR